MLWLAGAAFFYHDRPHHNSIITSRKALLSKLEKSLWLVISWSYFFASYQNIVFISSHNYCPLLETGKLNGKMELLNMSVKDLLDAATLVTFTFHSLSSLLLRNLHFAYI